MSENYTIIDDTNPTKDAIVVSGHSEGIQSAKDTGTGALVSVAAAVAYSLLAKPWLSKQGINLTGYQEAVIGITLTASLVGISSYIHGFFRGNK